MDSRKRVALVIGASGGIGRAIAIDLAREGADVIVNYQSRSHAAEEVVKEIEKSGSKAISVRADFQGFLYYRCGHPGGWRDGNVGKFSDLH